MKTLLFFLFIILSLSGFSQTIRFNRLFPDTLSVIRNVVVLDSGYVVLGGVGDYRSEILIVKIDLFGNQVWTKKIKDHVYNLYHGGVKSLQKTKFGYVLAGSKVKTNDRSVLLVKFNEKFDTLWTKRYLIDSLYSTGTNCITDSNAIYIIGTKAPTIQDEDLLLLKTDTSGNLIWYKTYGDTSPSLEVGNEVIRSVEGGFLIGGYHGLYDYWGASDWLLIKADSAGNQQWQNQYGNPIKDDFSPNQILKTKDSCYLVLGSIGYFQTSPYDMLYNGRIMKFNKNMEVLWDRQYFSDCPTTHIHGIVELANGDFMILKGMVDNSTHFAKEALCRMSPNGDIIWEQEYKATPDYQNVKNFLLDIKQTPDGGFIMAGTVFFYNGTEPHQQVWIVKTDSMGCEKPDCSPYFSGNIHGVVSYDNIQNSPVNNVKIYLKENDFAVDSAITNTSGYYIFQTKPPGNYTISATTTKQWSNVTATDALILERHVAGLSNLTDLKLLAADVTNTNSLSGIDAFLIKRRVAGLSSSFPSGDWYFNPQPVTVFNADVEMNFKAICFGDVNGSYVPSFTKANNTASLLSERTGNCSSDISVFGNRWQDFYIFPSNDFSSQPFSLHTARNNNYLYKSLQPLHHNMNKDILVVPIPSISLFSTETVKTNKGTTVEIPIKVTDNIETSAISLFLSYPKNAVEILSVTSVNSELIDMVTNIANGKLNIIWNRIQPISLHANDVLFTLNVRVLSDSIGEIKFELLSESEFANEEAQIIEGVTLEIPTIQVSSTNNVNSEKYSISGIKIIPNPAKDKVRIVTNETNAEISIFNAQGLQVFEKSINKETEIDVVDWKSGVYAVKVRTEKSIFVEKMVKE